MVVSSPKIMKAAFFLSFFALTPLIYANSLILTSYYNDNNSYTNAYSNENFVDYYLLGAEVAYVEVYFEDVYGVYADEGQQHPVNAKPYGSTTSETFQATSMLVDGKMYLVANISIEGLDNYALTNNYVFAKTFGNRVLFEIDINNDNVVDYSVYLNYYVNDINQTLLPRNGSIFNLGDVVEFWYNFSISQPYITKVYARYPYPIYAIDGRDYDLLLYAYNPDNPSLSQNLSFNLDTGSLDMVNGDGFFNVGIVIEGNFTPSLSFNQTYYLDVEPPRLLNNNLTTTPKNNTINEINDYFNVFINDTIIDLTGNHPCAYKIDNEVWQYIQDPKECYNLTLNNLAPQDHKIWFRLYDYANNTKEYYFVIYQNTSIAFCNKQGNCTANTHHISYPYNSLLKTTNLSLGEQTNLTFIINFTQPVYKAYFSEFPDHTAIYSPTCENISINYETNELSCAHTFNNIVFITNRSLTPINATLIDVKQDPYKVSEILGKTYLIATINLTALFDEYNITHTILRNISYDFSSILSELLNSYSAYDGLTGILPSLENEPISLDVLLSAQNRIIALIEGGFYVNDTTLSITSPVSVYLNQKIINYDPYNFYNVKTHFAMPLSDVYTNTSCSLIEPLTLDIAANENRIIPVKYSCDIIKYGKDLITSTMGDYYYVTRQISFEIPYDTTLLGKELTYYEDLANLPNFDKRQELIIYLDDLQNQLVPSIDGAVLKLNFSYVSGNHTIYIKYWYPKEETTTTTSSSSSSPSYYVPPPPQITAPTEATTSTDTAQSDQETTLTPKPTPAKENNTSGITAQITSTNDTTLTNEKATLSENNKPLFSGWVINADGSINYWQLALTLLILAGIGYWAYKNKKPNTSNQSSRMKYLKNLKNSIR